MSRSLTVGLGIAGTLAAMLGIGELYRLYHDEAEGRSTAQPHISRRTFDEYGYDADGLDRSNHTRDYYKAKILALKQFGIRKAVEVTKSDRAQAASSIVRTGYEEAVKTILAHLYGSGYEHHGLGYNLAICEKLGIFEDELVTMIHRADTYIRNNMLADRFTSESRMKYCVHVLSMLLDKMREITDVDESLGDA